MDKPMNNFAFKFMSFLIKIRDILIPRKKLLEKVGIQPGFYILDYGCGTGSYSNVATEFVGESGKVYALDIHPLAIQRVQKIVSKKGITNIETILSDCATGLPDDSIDVVLFYDVLHLLSNPARILEELHRVLKPNGILSVSSNPMKEEEMLAKITEKDLFKLSRKNKKTYNFLKK